MPPKAKALAKAAAEAAAWRAKARAAEKREADARAVWKAKARAAEMRESEAQSTMVSWRAKAGAAKRRKTAADEKLAAVAKGKARVMPRPAASAAKAAPPSEEDDQEEEEADESDCDDDPEVEDADDEAAEAARKRPAAKEKAAASERQSALKAPSASVLGLRPPGAPAGPQQGLAPARLTAQTPFPPLAPGLDSSTLGARLRSAVQANQDLADKAKAASAPPLPPPSLAPPPVIPVTGQPWVNLGTNPELISQIEFAMGAPIEVTLESPGGVLAATAVFLVQSVFPRDDQGIVLEVFFCGASSQEADAALVQVFPGPGPGESLVKHGLMHICSSTCAAEATLADRPVFHVDCFRHREVADLQEPWVTRGLPRAPSSEGRAPLRAGTYLSATQGASAPERPPSTSLPKRGSSSNQPVDDGGDEVAPSSRDELRAKVEMLKRRLEEKRKMTVAESLLDRAQKFTGGKLVRAAPSQPSASDQPQAGASSSTEIFRQVSGGVSRLKSPGEVAREDSGRLYSLGLDEVKKFLGDRLGQGDDDSLVGNIPSIITYLQAIFHGHVPQSSLGRRQTREMQTAALCLDALSRGDLPFLGDLLMQRFKKLELEALEGHEQAGESLELLPTRFVGLAGQQELEAGQAEEIRRAKVEQARRGRSPS